MATENLGVDFLSTALVAQFIDVEADFQDEYEQLKTTQTQRLKDSKEMLCTTGPEKIQVKGSPKERLK
jgi:hypothetical protein